MQSASSHERLSQRNLPEKACFDQLANFDSLALLHNDLVRVFILALAIQRRYTILLRVIRLERLRSSYEVMPVSNAVYGDTIGEARHDGTPGDPSDWFDGLYDFGLERWWDV